MATAANRTNFKQNTLCCGQLGHSKAHCPCASSSQTVPCATDQYHPGHTRNFSILFYLACIFMALGAARAEGPLYKNHQAGVGPQDPRQLVDTTHMPWAAIGRVQTELGTHCTGFLISPTLVETAAHCIWRNKTNNYVQPHSVHFLLGFQGAHYTAHARVKRFYIPKAYTPGNTQTTGLDRATLVLEKPIAHPDAVFRINAEPPPIPPGTSVMLAGYGQKHPTLLRADLHCTITGTTQDKAGHPLLAHSCTGTHGSSGAPLLHATPESWVVVGIQVLAQPDAVGGLAAPIHAHSKHDPPQEVHH